VVDSRREGRILMDRHPHGLLAGLIVVAQSLLPGVMAGDQPVPRARARVEKPVPADRPDMQIAGALRANPLTAPYAIRITWKDGSVVLSGRVGTKDIHDVAVRTAIAVGYPVKDDLVIDTGEAHRVAMMAGIAPGYANPWLSGSLGSVAGSAPYFAYPPPLFGRLDDPFFGFEPPLVSFPPWWRPAGFDPQVGAASAVPGVPAAPYGPYGPTVGGSAQGTPDRPGTEPIKGRLQLTVDMAGQVHLSGVVASEEDRRIIEDEARNTPGVSRVISELRVEPRRSETPPPPPQPVLRDEPEVKPATPAPAPAEPRPSSSSSPKPSAAPAARPNRADLAMARDPQPLTRRIADALSKRTALADLPIAVQTRDGVATLSGKVPSAYEAMLAYRTVEQIPGVRDVVDQLQFRVPDENYPNPLRQKGRPEDIEAYLAAQVRRHLGDLAHVDRVRVRGDIVEIRGTILNPADRDRIGAIIRSIPLLRDFRVELSLAAE
jgi:osmotically-inducible protein OsmY